MGVEGHKEGCPHHFSKLGADLANSRILRIFFFNFFALTAFFNKFASLWPYELEVDTNIGELCRKLLENTVTFVCAYVTKNFRSLLSLLHLKLSNSSLSVQDLSLFVSNMHIKGSRRYAV